MLCMFVRVYRISSVRVCERESEKESVSVCIGMMVLVVRRKKKKPYHSCFLYKYIYI
jgi:hypothetical protein